MPIPTSENLRCSGLKARRCACIAPGTGPLGTKPRLRVEICSPRAVRAAPRRHRGRSARAASASNVAVSSRSNAGERARTRPAVAYRSIWASTAFIVVCAECVSACDWPQPVRRRGENSPTTQSPIRIAASAITVILIRREMLYFKNHTIRPAALLNSAESTHAR